MSIKKWPIMDRPSEKLLYNGAESLSDSELLAIFIRCGSRGKSALDIAKELINQYESLAGLLATPPHNLLKKGGLSTNKYILLQAALEVARRKQINTSPLKLDLSNLDQVKKFTELHLAHQHREVFACLFLNKKLRLIKFDILFQGTIDQTPIYPREIIRKALHHNAACLILAHNHPSGDPSPSLADIEVTDVIKAALLPFDIELTDHIIVGQPTTYSFAENGLI